MPQYKFVCKIIHDSPSTVLVNQNTESEQKSHVLSHENVPVRTTQSQNLGHWEPMILKDLVVKTQEQVDDNRNTSGTI